MAAELTSMLSDAAKLNVGNLRLFLCNVMTWKLNHNWYCMLCQDLYGLEKLCKNELQHKFFMFLQNKKLAWF